MKAIQPITIWVNGQQKQGQYLNAYIINDNLLDIATFYWSILDQDADGNAGSVIAHGNLSIKDAEYIAWGESSDINEAAYIWIADQLGLTLI